MKKKKKKKKKYRRRKNQEPMGMSICSFSATQVVCSKLENQAKCDLAVFVTNPLKIHFSHTFWLLELAIIARSAIVRSLLSVCVYSFHNTGSYMYMTSQGTKKAGHTTNGPRCARNVPHTIYKL